MKLLASLVTGCLAVSISSLGRAHAEFCSTDQLAVASALTSDAGLLRACPSMANADILTGVAPCADPGCVAFLPSLGGRLPDCDVDDGKSFKDLFAAFVSVCRENAAAAPQPTLRTNATTTAPPANATASNATTTANGTATPLRETTNTTNTTNATATPVPTTLLPTQSENSTTGGNATAGGNATTDGNASTPDADTVGASTKPAVPAPAPGSLGVRPTFVGVAVGVVTALAAALVV